MRKFLLTGIFLLLAGSAWGAVGFDASGTCTPGGSGTTCTQPFTVSGANRLLTAAVCVRNGGTAVSGITYNGVVLTQYATVTRGGTQVLEIWRLIAPATGTHDLVTTMAADSPFSVGIASYTGVDQTTPLGTSANATGDAGGPTVDVSSASGELVIDSLCVNDAGGTIPTMTAGTGQTARVNFDPGYGSGFNRLIAASEEAGAATVTMSWSDTSSNNWILIGGPLKPAAAPPAASPRQRTVMILP